MKPALALSLIVCAAGCGSTQTSPSLDSGTDARSDGLTTKGCVPGQQSACACSGETTGFQLCSSTGASFGVCECPDGGKPVDAGRDAVAKDARSDVDGDSGKDASSDAESCSLPGESDAEAGVLQFAENYGNTGAIEGPVVAIDPSNGDVVVAAALTGMVNFGDGTHTSQNMDATAPGLDTLVARFDKNGAFKWSKDFGNGSLVAPNSVAVDSSGNIVVAGVFQGSVSFGGATLSAIGDGDTFVAAFSSTGAHRWSASFGSVAQVTNLDTVAVDPSGNVLIAGVANGPTNFGGGSLNGYYIAKFSSTGTYQWSNAFPAESTSSSPRLAVDSEGNMVLAGSFSNTANFGGGTLTSAGSSDAFVAKFNSSGAYQWAKQYGDSDEQDVHDVAVDACGAIFVTGAFGGTVEFGADTLTAVGQAANLFLAKISPTGSGLWGRQFVSSTNVDALNPGSIVVDHAGDPTATFGLSGSVDFGGGMLTTPEAQTSRLRASTLRGRTDGHTSQEPRPLPLWRELPGLPQAAPAWWSSARSAPAPAPARLLPQGRRSFSRARRSMP